MAKPTVVGVKATTLSPFHYHSLAVPSGTATLATYLTDRSIGFAIANALGALAPSVALPKKDYARHMKALPCLAGVFETKNPRLLRPIGRRLNLDGEGGFSMKMQGNVSTGNLKTWFFVQEVAAGVVYDGAVFCADPFEIAAEALGHEPDCLVVRTGRHLGGILKLEKAPDVARVRLNAHTVATLAPEMAD